jgi:hypothetical protein
MRLRIGPELDPGPGEPGRLSAASQEGEGTAIFLLVFCRVEGKKW